MNRRKHVEAGDSAACGAETVAQEEVEKACNAVPLGPALTHDFANLLTALLGHAQLALRKTGPHSPVWRHVESIEIAARRALDLARELRCDRQPDASLGVDLSEVVRETVAIIEPCTAEHARVDLDLGQGLPRIRGDAQRLSYVIMNLLANAAEALADGPGIIRVLSGELRLPGICGNEADAMVRPRQGRRVFVEVADTGRGMGARGCERIFDPFVSSEGSGLGLVTVDRIVREHGGEVQVRSSPGDGTAVRVVFPEYERPAAAA